MLLLYLLYVSVISHSQSYLHSTMLLLYLLCILGNGTVFSHLHSTMLLLYPRRYRRSLFPILIYIPLCFYFIQRTTTPSRNDSIIYIPLCFYFIFSPDFVSPVYFCIYIPLCFYFIELQANFAENDDLIYIPLCFYFIHREHLLCSSYSLFTFHYASTLSG